MTTRQLLLSFCALVVAAALTDRAYAGDPATLVAPTAAAAELSIHHASLTPSDAELKRIRNELRFELRGTLLASLDASIQSALEDSNVIAD